MSANAEEVINVCKRSTELVWEDRFDKEVALWDQVDTAGLQDLERAIAAVQLACVEFWRRVAGRKHKAETFVTNLEREAHVLREAAEAEEREQEEEDQEIIRQATEKADSDGPPGGLLKRLSLGFVGMALSAGKVVASAIAGSGNDDLANASPHLRMAVACESLAQGLQTLIMGCEMLEEGIASTSNIRKAIAGGMKLRKALRNIRILFETSQSPACKELRTKVADVSKPTVDEGELTKNDAKDNWNPQIEAIIFDMHCVFNGSFGLGARSATMQWLLRAIGLQANREEGLLLIRAGLECNSPFFRMLSCFSLSYNRLIEAEEFLMLGLRSHASEACREAHEADMVRKENFPDSKHMGAHMGMRMAFDMTRTGSSRLESRVLWASRDSPNVRKQEAIFGSCPNQGNLESLALDEVVRNCHYRLRVIWEVVLEKLGAWDLKGVEDLLPNILDDARRYANVSEPARGAVRNGGMMLAAIQIRKGRWEEAESLLKMVEDQQVTDELEGQFRTKLRIKLMRKRPKVSCVATLTLIEDLWRYRLIHTMTNLHPLKVELQEVLVAIDDLPDSWVPLELDLAANLWLGIIARVSGDLTEADRLLTQVIKLAEDNAEDLKQIPCMYHLYLAWAEMTCIRMEQGDWDSAKRCRKGASNEMHCEVQRTEQFVKEQNSGWLGLGGFMGGMKKLLIPPVHPLHPNCPLFFWQVQNLMDAAGRHITQRVGSDAPSDDEEWYSDQGDIDLSDDEAFVSDSEMEETKEGYVAQEVPVADDDDETDRALQ